MPHRHAARTPTGAGEVVGTAAALLAVPVLSLEAGRSVVAAGGDGPGLLVFLAVLALLAAAGSVHGVCRLGWLRRSAPLVDEEGATAVLDGLSSGAVVVLVPSYREDPAVVRRTLLSAALQEHPDRRVVLLVDDPPAPTDPDDLRMLLGARALAASLDDELRRAAGSHEAEAAAAERRLDRPAPDLVAETEALADGLLRAAGWLRRRAAVEPADDHASRFLADSVLLPEAEVLERRAATVRAAAGTGGLDRGTLLQEHRRLAARFRCPITSFERKQWDNLSSAPNKAMNLNAYLGLLGQRFRAETDGNGRRRLRRVEDHVPADVQVPDADYVVTLDADSVLLPGYLHRLVHLLEQPGHERTAVVQTPYSAFPGAVGAVERTAGAQTDVMHVLHQGSTSFGATFWVGANAVLRRSALEDIAVVVEERGHPVVRYVQDRTVIEDTESSIDLRRQGWQLHNHPERLSYSATPVDYGSLLIQRRRWANGGLLILPGLLRFLLQGPGRVRRLPEVLLRAHYLTSVATVNAALLLVLCVPLGGVPITWQLPVAGLPYLALYARDLRVAGHRAADVLRVYALNLLLLPVNLGGVVMSLRQAVTGRPVPFCRTPKVSDRTAAPALYVLTTWLLLAFLCLGAAGDLADGNLVRGTCAAANAALLAYGVTVFMGWRAGWADVRARMAWRAGTGTAGRVPAGERPVQASAPA